MPDKESILPSIDNSSMADINGSYQQAVKGMSLISIIYIILLLLILFTPLILTMYSLSDLISKLVSIVSG